MKKSLNQNECEDILLYSKNKIENENGLHELCGSYFESQIKSIIFTRNDIALCHGIQSTAMCAIADDFFDTLQSKQNNSVIVRGYINNIMQKNNFFINIPIEVIGIVNNYIDFVGDKQM
eukprot:300594_1